MPEHIRREPKVLVSTEALTEQEWLTYRRQGIGGSDVAAILGISPFRTARDLYDDKLNIASAVDDTGNWVALEMEDVQTECLADPAFARLVMNPKKKMVNCFHYINRKAREYLEQEMKDNDEEPMGGGFGGDVPDELCYQWAREYFRDADAKEDAESEEKFVPKTYNGKTPKAGKKEKSKKTEPKPAPKPADEEQLTFGDFGTEEAAG